MNLDELTVIVPTRNEAHNIAAFLASLPAGVRLMVVDASQDGTLSVARRLRPNNTVGLPLAGNIAVARQAGAEAARTRWLLFSDADVVFAPEYFQRLERYAPPGALYGPKLSQGEYAGYYRWFARGQRWLHRLGVPGVSGSNLILDRQTLLAAGGFDLRLTCTEDSELGWRLRRQGVRIDLAPDLIVYANDHRRLRRGVGRKLAHSIGRGTLLYLNLMPGRWRTSDQGYWGDQPRLAAQRLSGRTDYGSKP